MKPEEKNEEVDVNERAITLEVGIEVINKVRTGEITHILMDINENNQSLILENFDGNLVLVTEEMPTTFHGCYFYNGGEFPYAIRGALDFLVLMGGEDYCLTRIISVETNPGTRFNYQGAGKPIVEDPNGDSCVWEVAFEVVPVPQEPKKYLMRWNPSISSFTEKDFEECIENMEHGMFRINWSIHEWEEARRGDIFYMMRVGDDKAGIDYTDKEIHSAVRDGLMQNKVNVRYVDRRLRSMRAAADIEATGHSAISDNWDKSIDETLDISKEKWEEDED